MGRPRLYRGWWSGRGNSETADTGYTVVIARVSSLDNEILGAVGMVMVMVMVMVPWLSTIIAVVTWR